jgi:hypothetical protein
MAQSGANVQAHAGRLALFAGVIPSLLLCALSSVAAQPDTDLETLENRAVGYALRYPADWHVTGPLLATEFARDATCQSVQVIDFQPPDDAGGAGFIRHAFVQLCARPIPDGLALEEFLRRIYGAPAEIRFEPVTVGGRPGYRVHDSDRPSILFVQTDTHRIEIVAAVATDPGRAELRRAQVDRIVDSLVLRQAGTAPRDLHGSSEHPKGGEMR